MTGRASRGNSYGDPVDGGDPQGSHAFFAVGRPVQRMPSTPVGGGPGS